MSNILLVAAEQLSDSGLLERVAVLAGAERRATVELIAHLAALDRRGLYRGLGYGSLFSYCTEALHLAEHAAYNRIEAARVSRRFPVALDLLEEGAVNLSTLRLLAPHLTEENHQRLLGEAKARSKRDVELMVARIAPRPDVPASVRRLPAPSVPALSTAQPEAVPVVTVPPPPRPPVVAPLAPERYRVQFTVDGETERKLRQAQELLRREIPDGDPAAIFARALTLLLDDLARKKLARTPRPRRAKGVIKSTRHIPAQVRRCVWLRHGGQCAFVSEDGRRCRERAFLEFHHIVPYALGGETTADNITLRCRQHNHHEAVLAGLPTGPRSTRPGTSPSSDHGLHSVSPKVALMNTPICSRDTGSPGP